MTEHGILLFFCFIYSFKHNEMEMFATLIKGWSQIKWLLLHSTDTDGEKSLLVTK